MFCRCGHGHSLLNPELKNKQEKKSVNSCWAFTGLNTSQIQGNLAAWDKTKFLSILHWYSKTVILCKVHPLLLTAKPGWKAKHMPVLKHIKFSIKFRKTAGRILLWITVLSSASAMLNYSGLIYGSPSLNLQTFANAVYMSTWGAIQLHLYLTPKVDAAFFLFV